MDSTIRIDVSRNPKLKELASRLKVGDRVEWEVEGVVTGLTPEEVTASIKTFSFSPEEENDEGTIEADRTEPISIAVVNATRGTEAMAGRG